MAVTGSVDQRLTAEDVAYMRDLGNQLRVDGIRASTKAGSGHPTSSMSASDLLAVLITRHLHYDWQNPA
ncbi:MAG TPA: transketolase, partial [Candidatus Dormibacteraeota bacterium]|nr:transketolase [Candidatus Dormibacteraeota bacterium]